MKRRAAVTPLQQSQRRRRGALFHYYMMYLMLSSVLLTTAGLCIHAALKADRTDSVIARDLQTLLRLEGQLRADTRNALNGNCRPEEFLIVDDDAESTIRWTIDRNLARREVIVNSEVHSSDRFVFAKGTHLAFEQADPNVTLTIEDAAAVPADPDGQPTAATAAVQIVLWMNPTNSADGDAS